MMKVTFKGSFDYSEDAIKEWADNFRKLYENFDMYVEANKEVFKTSLADTVSRAIDNAIYGALPNSEKFTIDVEFKEE